MVSHHFGLVSLILFVNFPKSCFQSILKPQILLNAETEQGVAQAIIRSVVDFKRDPWPKVSDNAKDLVKKMLNPDPKARLTAQEVLGSVSLSFNSSYSR